MVDRALPGGSGPVDAGTRRRMLRLVAGGVPLMSAASASANTLAFSSAWRAARHDATQSPPSMSRNQDGWIRMRVSIVNCEPTATAGTTTTSSATRFRAYKVGNRYYRIPDMARVDLQALGMREASVDGHAYALVLFDSSARPIGVDPTRSAGSGGIQGMHCSSWRSIAGTNFPGCSSGFGV
jgi:hypothetical protein